MNPETGRKYVSHVRSFLKILPNIFSFQQLKVTLRSIPNQNNRSNKAKALRRFLRDYLKVIDKETAKEIKIERATINFEPIPDDQDVAVFFYALPEGRVRALYLLVASSGLRRCEAVTLRWGDIDFSNGVIRPKYHVNDETKKVYFTICNSEALETLKELGIGEAEDRIFPYVNKDWFLRAFRKAEQVTGLKIRLQDLRRWHADKLDRLDMKEKYVEFLQGKTPRTIIRRHYSDYSPDRLKRIYDKAGMKVLS